MQVTNALFAACKSWQLEKDSRSITIEMSKEKNTVWLYDYAHQVGFYVDTIDDIPDELVFLQKRLTETNAKRDELLYSINSLEKTEKENA